MAALLEQSGRAKPQRAACERGGEAVETRSMVFELVLACSLWTGWVGHASNDIRKININMYLYYNLIIIIIYLDFLIIWNTDFKCCTYVRVILIIV